VSFLATCCIQPIMRFSTVRSRTARCSGSPERSHAADATHHRVAAANSTVATCISTSPCSAFTRDAPDTYDSASKRAHTSLISHHRAISKAELPRGDTRLKDILSSVPQRDSSHLIAQRADLLHTAHVGLQLHR
jgi:hypothetical protein